MASIQTSLFPKETKPMTENTLIRVRIHQHMTQSRFLHLEDALNIGKIRLFAGNYRKGSGTQSHTFHFLSIPDARVVFTALAFADPNFSHIEYKGSPPKEGKPAESRVLSVKSKGDKVYIELKRGVGQLTPTGAIKPNGKPEVSVNVTFTIYEAQRMAFSALAYLQAWDICRMFAHKKMVSGFAPYLQSLPLTNVEMPAFTNGQKVVAKHVHSANGTGVVVKPLPQTKGKAVFPAAMSPQIVSPPAPSPAATVLPPRPVTRKAPKMPAKQNGNSTTTTTPKHPPALKSTRILSYGDGSLVNLTNVAERTTFLSYQKTHHAPPPSKSALKAFYSALSV
jgi:hypothetical protein